MPSKRLHDGATVQLLAYATLTYALASVVYLIITSCANVGTPFTDSLWPEQLAIKKKSARTRAAIFWASAGASAAVLAIWRPLGTARPIAR